MTTRRRSAPAVTAEMIERWLATFPSANTRSAYRADLAGFTAWCDVERQRPLEADADDLARYREYHVARGASPASVARRMSALNGFFAFAVHTGVRPTHPVATTAPTVVPASATAALTAAERADLIDALPGQTPAAQLLVSMLLLDGMKLDEALGLDHAHLRGRPPTVTARVTTRGQQRDVVLHPHTTTLVARHVRSRHAGPLFVSAARNGNGARLTRFGADAWLKKAGRDAGIDTPLSSNVLRRTHVVHAQRSGRSLDDIRRQLGHDDARTTRRYLAPDAGVTPTPPNR